MVRKLMCHVNIILGAMFIVFVALDIDNPISKSLLFMLSAAAIWQGCADVAGIRRVEKAREAREE